jgi:hypothetical protein
MVHLSNTGGRGQNIVFFTAEVLKNSGNYVRGKVARMQTKGERRNE